MEMLIVSSMLLGIAFCAPPGAVTAEAMRRGLARGFGAALNLELGSLIGDAFWAIIALIGLAFIVQNDIARLLLGMLGVFLLLRLAWGALLEAHKGGMPQAESLGDRGDFATGVVLSLGNPWAVTFWLGAGTSTVTNAIPNPEPIHFVFFFLAFMLAATLYCFFFSGLVALGRQFVNASFFRVVNLLCALFLGYFGLTLLRDVVGSLVSI